MPSLAPEREKIKTYSLVLALGLSALLFLENRAVRQDQERMRYAYGSFLSKKAGGRPLGSMIQPGSLAVFSTPQGVVACGVMK